MILINGKLYPRKKCLIPPNECLNQILYSPWTGSEWARIDLGFKEWIGERLPAKGERPYFTDYPPGSLFQNWRSWLLEALPRELLLREVSLLIDLKSPTIECYNYPTFDAEKPLMSPSLMDKIAAMRTKVLSGQITDEELREAIKIMRADRITATRNVEAAKARKAPMDGDAALAAIFG